MLIKWYNGFKIKNNIHAEISRRTSYESFPKRNNCLINSVLYVCFYFMPNMDNHRVSAAHNPFHKDWNFILRQQWSDLIHNQVFFFKIIFFKIGTLYKYLNTCLYFIISYSMTFHILLFFFRNFLWPVQLHASWNHLMKQSINQSLLFYSVQIKLEPQQIFLSLKR